MTPRALAPLLVACMFLVPTVQAGIWDTPIIIEQGQVVPPSGSPGAASGIFILDPINNVLQFDLQLDMPLQGNEIFAGIYGPADLGQNASLLFQLPNGWPKIGNWVYPDSLEGVLLNALTYCQIDTDVHPGGEIRGQLAAWQAQGLDQACALEYLNNVIVPFHVPPGEDFSAHFVGLNSNDSLLTAGTVVSDYDSTFIFTVPNDMYLFWIDDEPMTEWFHDTTFFFMDTFTGQLHVESGMSWPLIDGSDRVMTDDDSADCKLPPRQPLLPNYETQATNNTDAWAIIVVGKNLGDKTEKVKLEQDARKNDIERLEQYLNGLPRGPKVHKDNIKVVAGADTMGATLQEVCDQLNQMNGCSKLYFFYIGHGSEALSKEKHDNRQRAGHMILKKPGSSLNEEFTYYQLGCKLLERTSVKEYCIVIEACYSGKAIRALTREVPANKGKRLKGSLATSSRDDLKTRRDADGAFFIKSFFTCASVAAGDFNVDGLTTPNEAAGWAELTDPYVATDDAQFIRLGDSDAFKFKNSRPPYRRAKDGGRLNPAEKRRLLWELITYKYTVKGSRGQDSCVTKKRVVVRNPYDEFYKADCVMQWKGNTEGAWRDVPAIFNFYPKSHDKCNWIYLGEVDPRSTSIRVRKKPNKGGPPELGIAAFPDSADHELRERTTAYVPGEHMLHDFALRGNPGDQFDVTLDDIAGWGMANEHIEFNTSATQGELTFAVTGDAPMVFSNGGRLSLQAANLSCPDTLLLEVDALAYDSLTTAEGPGTRAFEALDMTHGLGLDATGGIIDWQNVSMSLDSSSTALVPLGGELRARSSQIEAVETQTVTMDVAGRLNFEDMGVVRATNGLQLAAPDTTSLVRTSVVLSAGDGLSLSGDLGALTTDLVFIDQSADDGLVADGVSNAALDAIIITNSGDQDVVVENSSTLLLRNSEFDDTKVIVDGTSQLTRSWSVGIGVEDSLGNALDLAEVEVRDALNNLVASFTTDTDGFSPILELKEWEQNGAVRTAHTPHSLTVMRGNVSENFQVTIDDKHYPIVVMSQVVSDVGDDVPSILSMAQNAPNPFGAPRLGTSTRIAYALPGVSDVRLQVYDVRGRLVTERKVLQQRAGWHSFDLSAQGMATGVYWYELRTIQGTERRKMIVIK